MDQGVALSPEDDLITMEIEYCGSTAIWNCFFWGEGGPGSPMKRYK